MKGQMYPNALHVTPCRLTPMHRPLASLLLPFGPSPTQLTLSVSSNSSGSPSALPRTRSISVLTWGGGGTKPPPCCSCSSHEVTRAADNDPVQSFKGAGRWEGAIYSPTKGVCIVSHRTHTAPAAAAAVVGGAAAASRPQEEEWRRGRCPSPLATRQAEEGKEAWKADAIETAAAARTRKARHRAILFETVPVWLRWIAVGCGSERLLDPISGHRNFNLHRLGLRTTLMQSTN